MDLTILAIVLGGLGALIAIITSIITLRRKRLSTKIDFPKTVTISGNLLAGNSNISLDNENNININSHLSDQEIGDLIESISTENLGEKDEKE